MIFDVMVKSGKNTVGKDTYIVCRVRDSFLSEYLRVVQNNGQYIVSVIPLFKQKRKTKIDIDRESLDDTMKYNQQEIMYDFSDGEDDSRF